MKLLTIQSKEVIDIVNRDGIYFADKHKSTYYKISPGCYNELMNRLDGKCPIFAWYKINGNNASLNDDIIKLADSRGVGTGVRILLEVPDNEVLLSDFYNYSDMIFLETEGAYDFKDIPTWEDVFDYVDENVLDIQALIKCIKKEWIIKYEEE